MEKRWTCLLLLVICFQLLLPFNTFSQTGSHRGDAPGNADAGKADAGNADVGKTPAPGKEQKQDDNVYEKLKAYVDDIYTKHLTSVDYVFDIMKLFLVVLTAILSALGGINAYKFYKERESLKTEIKDEKESMRANIKDELEKSSDALDGRMALLDEHLRKYSSEINTIKTSLGELEDRLRANIDELSKYESSVGALTKSIATLQENALQSKDLQYYHKKLLSKNTDEVKVGIDKIAEKYYYTPPIYRRLEELAEHENSAIKVTALRALSAFGDPKALKTLKKIAKAGDDPLAKKRAGITLENLKEEYPDLF